MNQNRSYSGALAGKRKLVGSQLDSNTEQQRKERDERATRRNNKKVEQGLLHVHAIDFSNQNMSDNEEGQPISKEDYSTLMKRFNRLMQQNETLNSEVSQLRMQLADQQKNMVLTTQVASPTQETKPTDVVIKDTLFAHTEKTLLTTRISQLFGFEPMTCGINQDVSDWLELFEDKCDRLLLSDAQKYSIVQDLLKDGAKMWFDTHKSVIVNWTSFKEKIIAHFELVMGIDSFNRYKSLYNRRRYVNESAVDYVHNMMKLCRKADTYMTDSTKIKHLLEGLNLKEKSYVEIRNPETAEKFMQILIECDKVTMEEGKRQKPWLRQQSTERSSPIASGPTTGTNTTTAVTEPKNHQRNETSHSTDTRHNGCWTCGSMDHYRHACPKNC